MFTSMPDVKAAIIRLAERENEVWIEWRLSGTRDDGTIMDSVGVSIFGVAGGTFRWGRIYTELARSVGDIEAQLGQLSSVVFAVVGSATSARRGHALDCRDPLGGHDRLSVAHRGRRDAGGRWHHLGEHAPPVTLLMTTQ
jgi:hypothetical protein